MTLKPESKSYLAETINAFSPWSSRSTTPKPSGDQLPGQDASAASTGVIQQGGDHKLNPKKKISLKSYPPDCPPLYVQWYHAVDVAKRKPGYARPASIEDKASPPPKKWKTFSARDSRAIEAAFQSLPDEDDESDKGRDKSAGESEEYTTGQKSISAIEGQTNSTRGSKHNTSIDGLTQDGQSKSITVPVNEDYLFDVDIERRELGPVYWLGPVYEVRRGSWFYIEGTTLRPCDENLALQLEEGYLKTTPWRRPTVDLATTDIKGHARDSSTSSSVKPSHVEGNTSAEILTSADSKTVTTTQGPVAYRLFGTHINIVAQYYDATTAYLLSDDFFSRMSSTVYQRFAGGAHLSGTKVVRGYSDLAKKKTGKDPKRSGSPIMSAADPKPPASSEKSTELTSKDVSQAPASNDHDKQAEDIPAEESQIRPPESTLSRLERRMTSLMTANEPEDPAKQDEEARKLEEKEISDDYSDVSSERQDREIEHLVLVTHGIGQRLGHRFETFNFIHDVNEFRKMLKSVYNSSPDLQALNAEVDKLPQNCRIQVLPICWRHMLDFPQRGLKHNRKEFDLADADDTADEMYPGLPDITLEGVPAVRNIIADLALDILLYQTQAYKSHISRIVTQECNRMYNLFKQRNPYFNGKVSLCGHSLGSALFFDILSEQVDELHSIDRAQRRQQSNHSRNKLDFDVEAFFLFGSPVGLFQMLHGKTIEGRRNQHQVTLDGSADGIDDYFPPGTYPRTPPKPDSSQRSTIVSSPKCREMFNIFHPTDPIAYRLEPLISPSMSNMKPQNLPYVKHSFLGAPLGHGITGIPAMVGQSVSDFWSNFSSGLADRFIHRSLGLSAEDAIKLGAPAKRTQDIYIHSPAGGTNIISGGVVSADPSNHLNRRLSQTNSTVTIDQAHPTTLLDTELKTLYAGFQKGLDVGREGDGKRKHSGDAATDVDIEEQGRKLRREEAKVRALNSNGRVDYSIQE